MTIVSTLKALAATCEDFVNVMHSLANNIKFDFDILVPCGILQIEDGMSLNFPLNMVGEAGPRIDDMTDTELLEEVQKNIEYGVSKS